jgi:hypothetical protein
MHRDLILRVRKGDHDAFTALAADAFDRLHRTARLILRSDDLAADAVQEALVSAWLHIRAVRDPDRFDGWLHRLVVRACYREARRNRRHGVVEIRVATLGARTELDTAGPAADRDQLERGIRRLSPEFTGRIVCGPPLRTETSTQSGDHQEFRGGAWSPTATEMSDPRLAGNYTISSDTDVYRAPGSETYTLGSETWRIETQSGAWEASSSVMGFPDGSYSTATIALVGEGPWDGLVAIWEGHYLGDAACAWDVRGVIFPAGPPIRRQLRRNRAIYRRTRPWLRPVVESRDLV